MYLTLSFQILIESFNNSCFRMNGNQCSCILCDSPTYVINQSVCNRTDCSGAASGSFAGYSKGLTKSTVTLLY